MSLFANLDLSYVLSPEIFLIILLGTFIGILIGALPGMGAPLAVALVLPFAYKMTSLTAVMLLLSVYQGAEYGGSISAIVLGIPGTSAAAATVLDGNPMSKAGHPGKAIKISLLASTIGGIFGGLVLCFFTEPIGKFSLRFSAPDLAMLGIVACFAIIMLNKANFIKGMISIILGVMLSTVGTDVFTGTSRYIYGQPTLLDGINVVAIIVGAFAVPEMLNIISEELHTVYVTNIKSTKDKFGFKDTLRITKPLFSGSIIGTVIGIFPALGGAIAAWISYSFARKISKKPEEFGKGSAEGIAAAESANNAVVGGSLVPLLSLGIPGSASAAMIAAALMMFGIQVGPQLFNTDTKLLSGIYVGFFIGCIGLYVVGRLLTPVFVRVLEVRNEILVPLILLVSFIGIYASTKKFLYIWIAIVFGTLLFFLRKHEYPLAPITVSFILGSTIEKNFRRALDLSKGSYTIFWKTTTSKVIFVFTVLVILFPIIRALVTSIKNKKAGNAPAAEQGNRGV